MWCPRSLDVDRLGHYALDEVGHVHGHLVDLRRVVLLDVAPHSCSTAATVRTSAADVVSSVKATSRWLGLPVSENVSGCACTKAESDALPSGSAVSVDRRCSPTCARLTRPRSCSRLRTTSRAEDGSAGWQAVLCARDGACGQ